MPKSFPIAVLISGTGRSLANLIGRIEDGALPASIRLVVSSKPGVRGLEIAEAAGITTAVFDREQFGSHEDYSAAVFTRIREAEVRLIVMAGFLKLLPVPADFENRVINIHPALIPAFCGHGFYGHRVHEAAIAQGVKVSGCTVHFVDNQYDHGPIILQKTVPVSHVDTPDSLADRVFELEKIALPEAIRLIAEGRINVRDGRVFITGTDLTEKFGTEK